MVPVRLVDVQLCSKVSSDTSFVSAYIDRAFAGNNAATAVGANAGTNAGRPGRNAKGARPRVISRHFYPSVEARKLAARETIAELERRQKLTAQMIDELKVRPPPRPSMLLC